MNGRTGFALVPTTARIIAVILFVVAAGCCSFFLGEGHFSGFGMMMGACMGTIVAGLILLSGYVYGDAGRRGMPQGAWAALTLLVPNALGYIIYFLMRKPIVVPCPACGRGVGEDARFCPACGAARA